MRRLSAENYGRGLQTKDPDHWARVNVTSNNGKHKTQDATIKVNTLFDGLKLFSYLMPCCDIRVRPPKLFWWQ